MNLSEQLLLVWKECPYMGASLCRLCVPSAFGGRAGFDVDTSHIFPQGVLTAITLLGGVAGDGRASTGCKAGLTLCSGAGSDPKLLD